MKKVIAALIIGSCLYFGGLAMGQDTLTSADQHRLFVGAWKHRPDLVSDLPFVVRVLTDKQACSGVVAKKGYVISAAHCFDTMHGSGVIAFEDGRIAAFSVVYRTMSDGLGDFAILKTDTGAVLAPPFSSTVPILRDLVFHTGYPLGYRDQFTTHGIIVGSGPMILIASTAIPGESGGPVFDRHSRVFAIIQGTFVPPTLAQAIPIGPALKALSELGNR